MNIYRHGDLLIKGIKELPKGIIKHKNNVVAEGEFTGHHHTLVTNDDTIAVFTDTNGKKYLSLVDNTTITHPEHKTIEINPGYYEVVIEQEFDPFEDKIRQVRD